VIFPLSDIYYFDRESSGWLYWKLAVNASLSRLFYMMKSTDIELVLFNLETQKILWKLNRSSPGLNSAPIWNLTGDQAFVVVANDPEDNYKRLQIISVSRDGDSHTLVDIPDKITYEDSNPSLSPDGRYIAFHGMSLYLFDIQKRVLFDLCIKPNSSYPDMGNIGWSPDGTQFYFQPYQSAGLVFDLGKYSMISLDGYSQTVIAGWMIDVAE
jgi:Tol biopolymer transport system component